MNNFHKYLENIKPEIDRRLDNIYESDRKSLKEYGLFGKEAVGKIIEFSKLGKSLRGGIFLLSCEIFGLSNREQVLDIACAIEIIQSSLLIHDDIIDNDFLRRGKLSVFAQYIPLAERIKIKDTVSFSKSMGICVGDIGFFYGMELFQKTTIKARLNNDVMGKMLWEIMIVGIAQMNDVYYGNLKKCPDYSEIENVYIYKTARYTFFLPLVLGAMISEKDKSVQKILEEIGICAGILYQIRDDEMGIFSDEKTIGKSLGSDLRENKKTMIRHFLYKMAKRHEIQKMDQIFGKDKITAGDISYIKKVSESVNLNGYLNSLKNKYRQKAYDLIKKLNMQKYKNILYEMVDFASSRKK